LDGFYDFIKPHEEPITPKEPPKEIIKPKSVMVNSPVRKENRRKCNNITMTLMMVFDKIYDSILRIMTIIESRKSLL
jgi:hypothetical protein